MLDLRLFRASLVPFALALLLAAFSLTALPGPLTSALPPNAFDAARAQATLAQLAAIAPRREPGSPGDDRLAAAVASALRGSDHLTVTSIVSSAATVRGTRRIVTVIAHRRGSERGAIVLLAHRDALAPTAPGSLSATAVLLELATDLAQTLTPRPVVFVSTSGGSGGNAGASIAARELARPLDAAIVIGDLAGSRPPAVIAWSGDGGLASPLLRATLDHALATQLTTPVSGPSALAQLARFALPLSTGEQSPFDDAGVAAALVQTGGERAPTATAPLSPGRLAAYGRAILTTVDALAGARAIAPATTRDLTLAANRLGGWAVRLLVGLLILAATLCTVDIAARARRRRIPLAPWLRWVLRWAGAVLAAELFTKLLAWSGVLPPLPPSPVGAGELPIAAGGLFALVSVPLVLLAALAFAARAGGGARRLADLPAAAGAPVALLAFACLLAAALWVANPYSAALVALPLILWVVVLSRDRRHSRRAGALVLGCSLVPFALALALEAHELGLGPLELAWTWLLVFAGGGVGIGALLACALAGAVVVVAALLLLHPPGEGPPAPLAITVRGPASYAGPGSLGGTDSALRPRPR